MRRSRILPPNGRLLVSTDLHGNRRDFEALRARFDASPDAHWVILGDLVHGPNDEARAREPELYDWPDESPALVSAVHSLWRAHPDRVHFVLGNHDAGHLGFRHTTKFHPDEVTWLESQLTEAQRQQAHQLFSEALLAVVAPCGLLLTHGSPGDELTSLSLLDGPLPPARGDDARTVALGELLWSYGQRGEVTDRLLKRLSAETGHELRVVVHGHDRDPAGWFVEGDNQVQPVIFGAPHANKRCLWLDLAARIDGPQSFREGIELLRVHSA